MSWSEGSMLMEAFIKAIVDRISDAEVRQEIYEELIPIFEAGDCDTLYECVDEDEAFHKALYNMDEYYRAEVDNDDETNPNILEDDEYFSSYDEDDEPPFEDE